MQSGLPLDKEYRRLKLSAQITAKIVAHIRARGLGPDDLLFSYQAPDRPASRRRLAVVETAGLTDPDAQGRRYRHGTLTAYNAAKCRCEHCRGAYASYRAARRPAGKDSSRAPRASFDVSRAWPQPARRGRGWRRSWRRAGCSSTGRWGAVGVRIRSLRRG
jgi:hypothetical protein